MHGSFQGLQLMGRHECAARTCGRTELPVFHMPKGCTASQQADVSRADQTGVTCIPMASISSTAPSSACCILQGQLHNKAGHLLRSTRFLRV